jgi:hypothetical protein
MNNSKSVGRTLRTTSLLLLIAALIYNAPGASGDLDLSLDPGPGFGTQG